MDCFKLLPLAIGLSLSAGCMHSEGNSCKDSAQILAMDQKSPGGTTGHDYIKSILGTHVVGLAKPQPSSEKHQKLTPKASTTPIPEGTRATLDLSLPPGAEYTYLSSEYIPCKRFQACTLEGVYCYNRFSIPVRAHLKSDDGSLDELWQGTLIQADPADPRSKQLPRLNEGSSPAEQRFHLHLTRPSSSFQGNFKVSAPSLPTGMELKEHEVALIVKLSNGKFTGGSIESIARASSPTTVGVFKGPVLSLLPNPSTPRASTGTKN